MAAKPRSKKNRAADDGGNDAPQEQAAAADAAVAAFEDLDGTPATGDGDAAGTLEQELAAEKDRALRLRAEMENLRGRTAREINDVRRYAALPIARDLLPVVDNIDRAIEAAEKTGDAENLLEGFRLVRQQLLAILAQHHCTPVEAESAPFDPQFHEAIQQFPSADVPAGHVLTVTQVGYQMHDRIVRPAQVIVSTGPPEAAAE